MVYPLDPESQHFLKQPWADLVFHRGSAQTACRQIRAMETIKSTIGFVGSESNGKLSHHLMEFFSQSGQRFSTGPYLMAARFHGFRGLTHICYILCDFL